MKRKNIIYYGLLVGLSLCMLSVGGWGVFSVLFGYYIGLTMAHIKAPF